MVWVNKVELGETLDDNQSIVQPKAQSSMLIIIDIFPVAQLKHVVILRAMVSKFKRETCHIH